jgi:hypothetical protein
MSLPTYAEISQQLGIPRCRGILPNGQRCHLNHEGTYDEHNVHWADRRSTRGGIRAFLHLAGMKRVSSTPGLLGEPFWYRYYQAQLMVNVYAMQLGIRFPREVSDHYRAQLKAMLVDVPTSAEGRREAMSWATP